VVVDLKIYRAQDAKKKQKTASCASVAQTFQTWRGLSSLRVHTELSGFATTDWRLESRRNPHAGKKACATTQRGICQRHKSRKTRFLPVFKA